MLIYTLTAFPAPPDPSTKSASDVATIQFRHSVIDGNESSEYCVL